MVGWMKLVVGVPHWSALRGSRWQVWTQLREPQETKEGDAGAPRPEMTKKVGQKGGSKGNRFATRSKGCRASSMSKARRSVAMCEEEKARTEVG